MRCCLSLAIFDPKGSVFNKLKLSSTKQTKKSISLKWTKVSKASKYVNVPTRRSLLKERNLYFQALQDMFMASSLMRSTTNKSQGFQQLWFFALTPKNNLIFTGDGMWSIITDK